MGDNGYLQRSGFSDTAGRKSGQFDRETNFIKSECRIMNIEHPAPSITHPPTRIAHPVSGIHTEEEFSAGVQFGI